MNDIPATTLAAADVLADENAMVEQIALEKDSVGDFHFPERH